MVIVATFAKATYERLPVEDEKGEEGIQVQQEQQQHQQSRVNQGMDEQVSMPMPM
ncbi:hypothetical protein Lalb_Chr15g0084611 [Lupinus albus]|uniref:Uncharacterized protein n=1 Tax=Lupinus albus TaxID=3870 RepID=A0A6A4PAE1_LUPAL|nr:hypothetical protein Lalb_Chr15g0084611 [Lupinus albus]